MTDLLAQLGARMEFMMGQSCGTCGLPHARRKQEYARAARCVCTCCHGPLGLYFHDVFPDLVQKRGSYFIITEAALDEAVKRLEDEIAGRDEI